ncbi:MAG: hypothetical protein BGO01_12745 [Armatimonadetes bacterium 55-13]|nr:toll/interleukin-1 receptor domain-containing protein [Armatimonadota bacterium]OJU61780.1 MAG: hypothetical protein BGO01_12745 [Armatimonadetes bacterium 55-13]
MSKLPEDPKRIVQLLERACKDHDLARYVLTESKALYVDAYSDYGIDYYTLSLEVPFELFNEIEGEVENLQAFLTPKAEKFTKDCSDGRITNVSISLDLEAPLDWRSSANPKAVSASDAERIWKQGYFRLFISHESVHREKISTLKTSLAKRFVDGFVAHRDIQPSLEWQKEISLALASCHAIVAIHTDNFCNSVWCMQEVGWGLGRGVLVQPIKVDIDPKGFLASTQALIGSLDSDASIRELRDHLISTFFRNHQTRRQMLEPLILSFEHTIHEQAFKEVVELLEKAPDLPGEVLRRLQASSKKKESFPKELELRINALLARHNVSLSQSAPMDEYDPFAD